MAEGVRSRTGADFGASVTGVAGPGGGSPDKPVGLVWIAVAGPSGPKAFRHDFLGDRASVRQRSVQSALALLWRTLQEPVG